MRHPTHTSQGGNVLLIALVLSALTVVLCAGLVQMVYRSNAGQGMATDAKESFQVAEAGLAEAFSGVRQMRTGNVGSPAQPAAFGDGLFWVEAEDLGEGLVGLRSTGMVGGGRATLELHLQRADSDLGGLGFFSDTTVTIPDGVLIDGFDSGEGSYEAQAKTLVTSTMGLLGSNGDIYVESGGIVAGDATPGTEGQIHVALEGLVASEQDPREVEVGLPALPAPVEFGESMWDPQLLAILTDPTLIQIYGPPFEHGEHDPRECPIADQIYNQGGMGFWQRFVEGAAIPLLEDMGEVPFVVPDGEQIAVSIQIAPGGEVVLTGPTNVTVQSLIAQPGSRLLLDTSSGPVELTVTGQIDFQQFSRLETTESDALQATILMTGPDLIGAPGVHLDADSSFYGLIAAPDATMEIGGDFEIFGAATARTLTFEPGARLHFDHAFASGSATGADRPRLISWRVVDIPLEVQRRALSPFQVLGVSRDDLRPPAEAHEDQPIEIEYVDLSGTTRTFSGMESELDKSQIQEVTNMERDGESVPIEPEELAAKAIAGGAGDSLSGEVKPELTAALADDSTDFTKLMISLVDTAPHNDATLHSIVTSNRFDQSKLEDLFTVSQKLPRPTLDYILDPNVMKGRHLKDELIRNSPLPTDFLETFIAGAGEMSDGHRQEVLDAQ